MTEEEIKIFIKELQEEYSHGFECREDGNYYSEESLMAVLKKLWRK